MPTWGQLVQELNELTQASPQTPILGSPSPHDQLRRKYLSRLASHTGRDTIVYATSWMEAQAVPPEGLQIVLGDVQAFMEVCSNLQTRQLDLILTTPGGQPEAAESIVEYLRSRFDDIRVIVPVAAMSAGTMVALAADVIVMGTHSQLGPIDPQMTVATPEGPRSAPAQAILDQFELAKSECVNPANIGAWLPMLRALLPGLLAYCESARAFAREYAERVLARDMFANEADPAAAAAKAAAYFGNFNSFRSHSRRVSRDDARGVGIKVVDLEADQTFQDLVLSVHHATRLSFSTGAHKVVENQHGRAYIQTTQQIILQTSPPGPAQPRPPELAPQMPGQPVGGQPLNRAQRRAQGKRSR